jgi:uncharacterized protein
MPLTPEQRVVLLALARESISAGLASGTRAPWTKVCTNPELQMPRATFVTLRIDADLRGCCGTLVAARPLAQDVWHCAWSSAFADPRFPPLRADEWPATHLHVSVLTPPAPFPVDGEEELLQALRPGIDGLVLEYLGTRATFLPSVWEQMGSAREFLTHLKLKAGWAADFWSPAIKVARYETEDFEEADGSEP